MSNNKNFTTQCEKKIEAVIGELNYLVYTKNNEIVPLR